MGVDFLVALHASSSLSREGFVLILYTKKFLRCALPAYRGRNTANMQNEKRTEEKESTKYLIKEKKE